MEELPFSGDNFLILLTLVKKQSKKMFCPTGDMAFTKDRIKELEGWFNGIQAPPKKKEKALALYSRPFCGGKTIRQPGRLMCSRANHFLFARSKYQQDVLDFFTSSHVSYDKNQVEGDIRMSKTKCEISDHFSSIDGANLFCQVGWPLSAVKKNRQNMIKGILDLFWDKVNTGALSGNCKKNH